MRLLFVSLSRFIIVSREQTISNRRSCVIVSTKYLSIISINILTLSRNEHFVRLFNYHNRAMKSSLDNIVSLNTLE